jgi:transcription termination/antitermination protein NusA
LLFEQIFAQKANFTEVNIMEPEIGGDLMPVLEQIERDKGIKKEDLLKMIETALVTSFKKHEGRIQDVECKISPETGVIEFYIVKKVVEKIKDDQIDIDLESAKKIKSDAKLGDDLKVKIDTSYFGRIAAQTAKQVIIQRIREKEKENLFKEFKTKEGDIVNGQIIRIAGDMVIFDLGKSEAILPPREQMMTDTYNPGSYMKVFVFKVEHTPRGAKIILSRTHPDFLKKLFELEVPEVYDGTVIIKAIVRDPGVRAKVTVISTNPKVDPIGACVGIKGSRIKAIIDELNGEKIDLVPYNSDMRTFITSALNPAKIDYISLKESEKKAEVVVPDDQLSIAIGKKGQNIRLAARLTGWYLDIKSSSKKEKDKEEIIAASVEKLEELEGIGDKTAEILVKAGYNMERLKQANLEELMGLQGVGEKTAETIMKSIKKYFKEHKNEENEIKKEEKTEKKEKKQKKEKKKEE